MFFDTWQGLARVLIIAPSAYIALVVLLRFSGKRTLSKMNAFDFVVTVALGSTLATIILSNDVALAEGVAAFATLILLQFIITWLSTRSPLVRRLVKGEPTLLFHNGEFLQHTMNQQRVINDEVLAAIREQGITDIDAVGAVVLETDGSFSVLPRSDDRATALRSVGQYPGSEQNMYRPAETQPVQASRTER